jgi:hypothetical protein
VRHLRADMKRIIQLIFLTLIFSSCSSNKLIGLYGKCGNHYFSCYQIELKNDHTFEEYNFMDVGGGVVKKGKWNQIHRDTILINSFEQPINPKATYKGKIIPNSNGVIKIKVSDFETLFFGVGISINNGEQEKVDDDLDGIVEFNSDKIFSVEYQFLGQKEKILIDNPEYNYIEIIAKDLGSEMSYITNKKILIGNRKLIFNTDKHWSMFALKKTGIKNKQ